ncbi:hypothetical protein [Inquilinus sp. CA228]|uniref:hypothetical protein n=1 Tax=Inquilinus sp. CA228 TaxID=3455609 RepID=UPI003F8D6807
MSEYQYYEFQAVDRPLDRAAQDAVRAVSSRARITATSFTNEYNWGDFRGDPRKFMERWFDLHLYLANWGTRRLMMRVPERLLSLASLDPFLGEVDWVKVWVAGDNLIVDILRDEVEIEDHWEDDSGRLAALAPLRADVLSADLRVFYLLWLAAVQDESVSDGDVEPLPGIGPLTAALEVFARFFDVDPDLVQAAAESGTAEAAMSKDDLRDALASIAEDEKSELLLRVVEGDSHVAAELLRRFRRRPASSAPRRTAGSLRIRAQEIAEARERAEAERLEKERRRQAEEAGKARRIRLVALRQRGAAVWREVEVEIQRRNPAGYDHAVSLLVDLQALAAEDGSRSEFGRRLAAIRSAHETKRKFIERLIVLEGEGAA